MPTTYQCYISQSVDILGAVIPVGELVVVSLLVNTKLIIDGITSSLEEGGALSTAGPSHHNIIAK